MDRLNALLDRHNVLCSIVSFTMTALLMGEGLFGAAGLLACSVFGHGVVVLGGYAVLMRRLARVARCALLMVLLPAVAFAVFVIESTWLPLRSSKITCYVRVVVIADLQTGGIGVYAVGDEHRRRDVADDLRWHACGHVSRHWFGNLGRASNRKFIPLGLA